MSNFKKLNLKNVCDCNERFRIYIDDTNSIIYKQLKNPRIKKRIRENFDKYKNIILNTNNQNICSIEAFNVEDDGSYKCNYIKGFTLYQIKYRKKFGLNDVINQEKSNIIDAIEDLKKEIIRMKSGDWHINNLVYSLKEKKIYNVDCEGYFTYPNGICLTTLENTLNNIINSF